RLENEVNIELTKAAGSTRGKGKARQGAKKGRARGSRKEEKEYATQRGRYRGSRTGDDTVYRSDVEPNPPPTTSENEGLYEFVQTSTCRREVIRQIFNNPETFPTVKCCDICNPELLDLTRPGMNPRGTRQPRITREEKSRFIEDALDDWRDSILGRDFPAIKLVEGYLKQKWVLWPRYGEELLAHILALDPPPDTSDDTTAGSASQQHQPHLQLQSSHRQ
ncbi:hypothetical protein BV22DRAFT_1052782, partial [Leucogyrophana mollusca]